jgi:hypothetical protein
MSKKSAAGRRMSGGAPAVANLSFNAAGSGSMALRFESNAAKTLEALKGRTPLPQLPLWNASDVRSGLSAPSIVLKIGAAFVNFETSVDTPFAHLCRRVRPK